MSRRNNSFALFTATGRILAMIAGFLMPIFLTRYLTQENYGLYSQFNVLVGFMSSIFSFGMQSNLYYYFPNSDEQRRKALVGNTYFTMIVFAIVAFVLLLIPATAKLFIGNEKLMNFSLLVAVGIFFSVPILLIFPLFVTRGDKTLSVVYPPLEALLRIGIVIGTALVFNSIESILLSMVVYHVLQFVFVTLYASWPYRKVKGNWFDWGLLKSQFAYAAPFGLAVILNTVFQRFDKMLCISFITPEEYAIYSLAFYGIPGIHQVYESVGEVNILNMSAAYKENNLKETISLAQSYVTRLMSFSIPIILGVFVFAGVLFDFLFPPEYAKAIPFFRIYVFSFVIGALGAGLVLRATGKTRYTLKAYLRSAVVFLPFAYFSIKYYGTWGAIITAMLGILLPKVFQISFEMKILKVSFWQYMPWNKIGIIIFLSVLFILPVVLLNHFVKLNIFVAGGIGVIYVLAVWFVELKRGLFIMSKESLMNYLSKIKFLKK
ncbi:MAG: oligosaccharide flippase family protein [Bacteroidales bacterium]|nr:oligosaccharide flippase family protein [Bacteroidales bacterium]